MKEVWFNDEPDLECTECSLYDYLLDDWHLHFGECVNPLLCVPSITRYSCPSTII